MKQFIKIALFATTILGTMTLTGCSSDNDSEDSKIETDFTVNPQKVFTGGFLKGVSNAKITRDAKGRVLSFISEDETATFEYKTPAAGETNSPHVIMTIESEDEKLVCNLYLGKDGFVKHCDETEIYKGQVTGQETWDFTYNGDGQLLTMLRSEGGHEKTTVTYKDGDIVEVTEVSIDEPDVKKSFKIFYTSPKVPSPIANKGCVMFYDALGIDVDEMDYAYYAGMLGKATKNLPVSQVDKDGGKEYVTTWTINAQGYPTKLLDADQQEYVFFW